MDPKKPNIISAENKEILIKELVDYFSAEHDINVGIIAAGEILDKILEKVDKSIYNQAIEDAQKIIRQGHESIIVNVGALSK
ncbi:MAG: DUF2164 family protein [Microgenomates group bacterium]